jgi:hypothetical protein
VDAGRAALDEFAVAHHDLPAAQDEPSDLDALPGRDLDAGVEAC